MASIPSPGISFYTFNNASGKNLNWFWNNWYFSNGYIDLAIQKVTTTADGASIAIQNIGGFPAPVNVILNYADGSSDTKHMTPAIWEKDQKQALVKITTKKKIKSIELNGGIYMDADMTNNFWK